MDSVWPLLRRLWTRPEPKLFGAAFLALAAVYGFLVVAHEVAEGELVDLDNRVLELARERVVGSSDSVVAEVARNLTALGGYPVLTLLLVAVVGFLIAAGARAKAVYVALATGSGALLSDELKSLFERARPTLVERLTHVGGFSFPSGHALTSAVAYLTLGILLAGNVRRRRMKLYVLTLALLLPALIGVSRVLLGVHYPSDVVAGWMVGLAWALGCWIVFELVVRRLEGG